MRQFHGAGGRVFIASDPLRFTAAPMADVGDGFDWRLADPGKRLLTDELTVEVAENGGWLELVPLTVYPLTGRISLARCMRGRAVRANGVCRPIAEVGVAEAWHLSVEATVVPETTLTDEHARYTTKSERRASCALDGFTVTDTFLEAALASSDLLVHLPFRAGVFAAVGALAVSPDTSSVQIELQEGSVSHVQC